MEKAKNSIYNHVLRYTGLFGGVQGFSMLMSFVRNKFVAVLLGSIGIGLIDLYNRTVNLFAAMTQLIVPVASVRALSLAYETGNPCEMAEQVRIVRSWTLLTALVGFLLCALSSPLLSHLTFGDYHHWLHFVLLAPIIPLVAISGSELSILKATRRLKSLAWTSFWGAVTLAVFTIPFYVWLGIRGVVPALLFSTLALVVVQLCYTLPLYKWRSNPFSLSVLRRGAGLVRLSLFYIVANVVAAGAEYAVRYIMGSRGNIHELGLYSSGMILMVAVGHFIFVTMDADYYPRLSACCNHHGKMNLTVNRQLEVCVLLLSPFLVFYVVFIPSVIQLLFSSSFLAVIPMAVLATFYMYFKAITTPVAYIALAKGDGRTYLVMECCYYVVFVLLIGGGFWLGGIAGTGIALSLSNLFDLLLISWVYHRKYHFAFSRKAMQISLIQGMLVLSVVSMKMCWKNPGWAFYACGIVLGLLSTAYSLYILSQRSSLKQILHINRPSGK